MLVPSRVWRDVTVGLGLGGQVELEYRLNVLRGLEQFSIVASPADWLSSIRVGSSQEQG